MEQARSLRSQTPRPNVAEGVLRTYVLSVRLTPGERSRVLHAARSMALSASSLARLRVLGEPLPAPRPVVPIPEINVATYRELGRIGNNLNQLARHFNMRTGDDPGSSAVASELSRLASAVRELQAVLWSRP